MVCFSRGVHARGPKEGLFPCFLIKSKKSVLIIKNNSDQSTLPVTPGNPRICNYVATRQVCSH